MVVQVLKRRQLDLELFHATKRESGKLSRNRAIEQGFVSSALHRIKVMLPQAQQN